jgi:GTP pyrophosphokinase
MITDHRASNEIYAEIMENMRRYHPSKDFDVVDKAYKVAVDAHKDQLRASGEPYIVHPLEVARILTDIELDKETITAAILHDVIEDTRYTYDNIAEGFGEEIAMLVDGVTKLTKMQYENPGSEGKKPNETDIQADNYRKMFLAMSHDIRVIIIKIADRLHNLRTLRHMPPEHQKRKADETLDIYAPLAHRLGIAKIRYELEDLAFKYQNPAAYEDLKIRIQRKQGERRAYVERIVESIKQRLEDYGVAAEVEGRPKHFFSIYKKMMQKGKTLDQIFDLFAVRVIVQTVNDCYHVLGAMHEMYKPVPERFKDYIAMPKANMYQAIHNTLIGPEGEPFEIQIKTRDMYRTAEYGIAAHWKYKEGQRPGNAGGISGDMNDQMSDPEIKLSWLRQMMEWQRDVSDSTQFLSELKQDLSLYKDHVYCFSPKGAVINLVTGATTIDFAYAIHSAIGNQMVGAKVNNRMVPIHTVLATGDRVEIITSQNSKGPNMDWLKIVKTGAARTKIQAWFKKLNREDNKQKGVELLEKGAKKKNLTLDDLTEPAYIAAALNRYSLTDWDTLCAVVGHGGLSEGQVINRLHDEYMRDKGAALKDEEKIMQLINEGQSGNAKHRHESGKGITIMGIEDMSVRFARCCNPVPGDEVVGFITRGRGITVHRSDCINIISLEDSERMRLTQVEWHLPENTGKAQEFRASLDILCEDKAGLVMEITRLLLDEKINLDSINSRKNKNGTTVNIKFPISGRGMLEKLTNKLMKINGVYDVARTVS